ncbi:MAG: NPCBM/NEW2 domain-containing protein [Pseudonocardiales bacterium]
MGQQDREVRPQRAGRDKQIPAALIQAIGAVLAATVTVVGGLWTNLLTYTGPGAAPLTPATVTLPPSTVTVSAPPGPSRTEQPGPANILAAGSVSLTDLKPVEGSAQTGPQRVNTRSYSDTVYQYSDCRKKSRATYQLDRSYNFFEAIVGPSDDSQSNHTVVFEITVDGREVRKDQVAVGESRTIRADVGGGYRMTISVISEGVCSGGDLEAVWAEPTLTSTS